VSYATDEKRREYKKRHARLHYYRGSAARTGPCVDCGEPRSEWSQKHGTTGLDFDNDYVPRCRRCHRNYDEVNRPVNVKVLLKFPRSTYVYRLSWTAVREIRRRAGSGEKHAKLAREFGISRSHVTNVVSERVRRER
jgi:hypothetical protein